MGVKELYTARTLVERIEGINNAIKAVDEIFEVYMSESCDW